jgi:phage terminase Nu1 subunit (DNA packaging protein)
MAAAQKRTFSLFEAASILGVHRNTLAKWINDGCPVVTKGDRDRGIEWEICIADVIGWREERLIEEISAKYQEKGGLTNEAGYRTRKAAADAVIAEIEAEEALRRVVDVEHVTSKLSQFLTNLRERMASVGAKVAGRAASMKSAAQIKELIDQEIRESLRTIDGAENIGADRPAQA